MNKLKITQPVSTITPEMVQAVREDVLNIHDRVSARNEAWEYANKNFKSQDVREAYVDGYMAHFDKIDELTK